MLHLTCFEVTCLSSKSLHFEVSLISVNVQDEWLMDSMMADFEHIRDRLVILKLLQTLLHDVEFLEKQHILDRDEQYKSRFIRIFHRFKHKLTVHPTSTGTKEEDTAKEADSLTSSSMSRLNALKRMASTAMKSKIIFRKQAVSKRVKLRNVPPISKPTTNRTVSTNRNGKMSKMTTNSFEHFTERSMKIVDCIISGKQDLLAQFVTSSPTKSPSKLQRKTVEVLPAKKRKNVMPPPPVFEPFRGNPVDKGPGRRTVSASNLNSKSAVNPRKRKATESVIDLSTRISRSSLESARDNGTSQSAQNAQNQQTEVDIVPSTDFEDDIPLNPYAPTSNDTVTPRDPYSNIQGQNDRNIHRPQRQQPPRHSQRSGQPFRGTDHGDDFSFDFQRISNRSPQRKRTFSSMQHQPQTGPMQRGYGFGDGFNNYYGQNGVHGQHHTNSMAYSQSNFNPQSQSPTQFGGASPAKKVKKSDDIDANKPVGDEQLSDLLGFFS